MPFSGLCLSPATKSSISRCHSCCSACLDLRSLSFFYLFLPLLPQAPFCHGFLDVHCQKSARYARLCWEAKPSPDHKPLVPQHRAWNLVCNTCDDKILGYGWIALPFFAYEPLPNFVSFFISSALIFPLWFPLQTSLLTRKLFPGLFPFWPCDFS